MTQYAVLLYTPSPADIADIPAEELEAHMRYGEQIEELGGKFSDAQVLQSSATATTIRGDVVSDGAYHEGDVLSGFFILEARDLDHALEIAKLCPATWRGGVEVRPLFVPPAE